MPCCWSHVTDVVQLDSIIWTHVLVAADGVWVMWLTGRTSRFFAIASLILAALHSFCCLCSKYPSLWETTASRLDSGTWILKLITIDLIWCHVIAFVQQTDLLRRSAAAADCWLTSLLPFWRFSGGCLKNRPLWRFARVHWLHIELYGVSSCLLTHRIELNWRWQRSRPLSESFCPQSNLHLKGRPEEECV